MPDKTPKRLLLVAIAIAIGVVVVLLWRASTWPSERSLVGMSERAVQTRYGTPEHEFAGHYGNPSRAWTQQFKGEIKSVVFRRLFGAIYVTYEKRNGQWFVIDNSYLPRGAAF